MMPLDPDQSLFFHIYGKAVKITAVFTDVDDANRYMLERQGREGVIASWDGLVLIAACDDLGFDVAA